MNEPVNPYAPPQQPIEEAPPSAKEEPGQYYTVPPTKLVLLSLATLGIYEVYWMFRQWQAVRAKTGADISSFWRAVFSIFFCNALFKHVRADSLGAGVPPSASTDSLSAIFIACHVIGRIADRIDIPLLPFIGFGAIVPLVLVQREINEYLERTSPGFNRNDGFSPGLIVLLVLGAALWALMIIGMLQPE